MVRSRLNLLLTLALLTGPPSLAAGLSVTTTTRSDAPNLFVADIAVADAVVMRLRGSTRQAVEDRAGVVADRLTDLALAGIEPADIRVVGGRQPAVRIGKQTLITVDGAQARLSANSPAGLAASWAGLLKEAFAQPYVAVAPARLTVPYLERRTIRVGGTVPGAVLLGLYAPDIIEPEPRDAGRTIAVRGVGVGATALGISRGDQRATVPIEVRKWAAVFGSPERILFTGARPAQDVLTRLALNAALAGTHLESGAHMTASVTPPEPSASAYRVALRAAGGGHLSAAKALYVRPDRMPPPAQPPSVLLVSNEPENVSDHGDLFVGTLEPRTAARLLYHHKCVMAAGCQLWLELCNVSSQTAAVHVLAGAAGPHPDELFVGHLAARRFYDSTRGGTGYVLYVPPGRSWSAFQWPLAQGEVASGLLRLTSLNQAEVRVCLSAREPRTALPVYPEAASPYRLTTAHMPGTRFSPTKRLSARYAVGDGWLFLHLGKSGTPDHQGTLLHGDYGIAHEIEIQIENGTPLPRRIEVALRAGGGAARGIFVIDGQTVETDVLYPGQEDLLHKLVLPPKQQRTLSIETMPESASSYPVTLVVRSR